MEDGGKDIRQRLIYQKKPGGSYQGLDTFDTSERETRTELVFSWKQYYVNITVDGLSMLKNSGAKQISDLVQDEMDEAEISAGDYIGSDIFLDGTGNSNKAKIHVGTRVALGRGIWKWREAVRGRPRRRRTSAACSG